MAVNIRLVQVYVDVVNKVIVSVNGSPSSVPPVYYGDMPTFQIFPVQPISTGVAGGPFSGTQYQAVSLVGFTMNITLGPAPSATSPHASFASLDTIAWDPATTSFFGTLDLTQTTTRDFIGNNPNAQFYLNFDVYDATLKRTTLFQSTSSSQGTIYASIDTPATGPAGPTTQYLTLQQALNIFLQIAGFPGKFAQFQSPDGTKQKTLSLNNDGTMSWT